MLVQDIYKNLLNKQDEVNKAISLIKVVKDKEKNILSLSLNDFYIVMNIYNTQKKSPYFEQYFINLFNLTKIPSSKNRGDAVDENNRYYEIKTSFNNEKNNLNLRQIRLYQDVDYYLCIYFDKEIKNRYVFLLSKEDMKKEIKLHKSQYSHGVKIIQNNNNYSEYSLTINIFSDTFKRWENKYLSKRLTKLLKAR